MSTSSKARQGKKRAAPKASEHDTLSEAELAAAAASATGDEPGEQEVQLGKIRDILFGEHSRDQSRRTGAVERRLLDSERRIDERIDRLERFSKSTTDALAERIKAHRSAGASADGALRKELFELAESFAARAQMIEEKLDNAIAETRQQTSTQLELMRAELRQYHRESTRAVEAARVDLRRRSVDRLALAELFSELSSRLQIDGGGGE